MGRWGEEQAANYLRRAKYEIVGMNYRTRFGEIDIIARNKKYIAFVEVKLRRDAGFARASDNVTYKKRERIKTCAEMWLSANGTRRQPRFDVIEVYAPMGTDTANPEINHIENAFE